MNDLEQYKDLTPIPGSPTNPDDPHVKELGQNTRLFSAVESHTHNGIDSPKINANNIVGLTPSASPGWQFVSYTTGAPATSVTISGLDLSTDKNYYIIIDARCTVAAAIYSAQMNSDSTGNAHHWAAHGMKLTNGSFHSASDSEVNWQLATGYGDMSVHCTMFLAYNSGTPVANWTTGGTGWAADTTARASVTNGAGYFNSGNNITSIKFARNDSNNADWAIWVFKSSQS